VVGGYGGGVVVVGGGDGGDFVMVEGVDGGCDTVLVDQW
jgi:hypothetical protein